MNGDIEVTVIMRARADHFPLLPEVQDVLEELFECDVLEIHEEEV